MQEKHVVEKKGKGGGKKQVPRYGDGGGSVAHKVAIVVSLLFLLSCLCTCTLRKVFDVYISGQSKES